MARLAVEERRALLLQAAARVIARVGVSDATTRAIADEAGMSQGAFHYCFRSKDELLRQMLTDLLDHLDRRARNALDATRTSASAGAALRDGLRTLWSELASRENENLVLYELTVVALRSPELNDLPAQQYERYFSIMEQFLRDVAERWNITWTRPVERLARFAVAGIDGLGLSWLVTRDDDTVTGVLHDIACHLQEHAAPAP
ncbi:TetR/AcrR family transcriptional regulator [Streptomyces brevispora]|uniref:TetR/AcrR family transcriptional regulator n=1 Tax=Streptomyces brevispora TaxID=887462 RepID=UPI002E2EEC38|nr:helix-turn-helix domain-containing protein [Streptomyces brevispora]